MTWVQGIYEALFESTPETWDIHYQREFVSLKDGGQMALDWSFPCDFMKDSDFEGRPILCLFPGLTGTSGDVYILNTIVKAHENDYVVVVVNHRGAPGTVLNTPKLYNAASSDDTRQALEYIHQKRPDHNYYAIGFSLGANLLTKYLGEQGEDTFLKGACVVSNPWDFAICEQALQTELFGLYNIVMTDLLVKKYKMHYESFQSLEFRKKFNLKDALAHAKTFAQFDIMVTCQMDEYESLEHYYQEASSSNYVQDIRIPTFCLSALDDPITSGMAIPFHKFGENEFIFLGTTKAGGHNSWFDHYTSSSQWFTKPVFGFLEAVRNMEERDTL
jgi:predicted alpha/beta-fold hydrolase